jgi:hypothetical protein
MLESVCVLGGGGIGTTGGNRELDSGSTSLAACYSSGVIELWQQGFWWIR